MKLYLRIRHYRHTLAGYRLYRNLLTLPTVPNDITLGIDGKGLRIRPRVVAAAAFNLAVALTDMVDPKKGIVNDLFFKPFHWGMEVSPMGGMTQVTLRIVQPTGITKEHSAEAVCNIIDQYNKKTGVTVALKHLLTKEPRLVGLVAVMEDDPVARRIQEYVPWFFKDVPGDTVIK